MEKTAV